ncbi:MAG TPA: ABC transporter permease subunit [Syntrophomonas sp.]|nr:ABC transporter permease subunit [Syntrophomonas sp.]
MNDITVENIAGNTDGILPVKKPVRKFITVKELLLLLLPPATMLAALNIHMALPNVYPVGYKPVVYPLFLESCLAVYLVLTLLAGFIPRLRKKMLYLTGLLSVAFILIEVLDIATLKTGKLMLPFVPSPDKIIYSFTHNLGKVAESFVASIKLLFTGLFFGTLAGAISGILIGWSKHCNYWLSPVLKILGPVPSAAWLPIAVVLFPTNHAASVFIIALSVWFPLTVTLSSGIMSTNKSWIEAARILGASEWYILFHVAIPAALPTAFIGMFMGLGLSFTALIVAEMLGVKAGLGWYISWAQAWGEYARIFSTVMIFSIIFCSLISLLFKLRDHLLKWQKGSMRW